MSLIIIEKLKALNLLRTRLMHGDLTKPRVRKKLKQSLTERFILVSKKLPLLLIELRFYLEAKDNLYYS